MAGYHASDGRFAEAALQVVTYAAAGGKMEDMHRTIIVRASEVSRVGKLLMKWSVRQPWFCRMLMDSPQECAPA
ncbi:MAG: hypothetical protein ABTQ34_00500 [Bdellovibrionales bacterium]